MKYHQRVAFERRKDLPGTWFTAKPRGIADVDLRKQAGRDGQRERFVVRSWEVATRIAWRESPRTDSRGKLTALVEPGKHRFAVGWYSCPPNLTVVESEGQELECHPGETVQLRFTMRKRR